MGQQQLIRKNDGATPAEFHKTYTRVLCLCGFKRLCEGLITVTLWLQDLVVCSGFEQGG